LKFFHTTPKENSVTIQKLNFEGSSNSKRHLLFSHLLHKSHIRS
jgi:hypothetical protein